MTTRFDRFHLLALELIERLDDLRSFSEDSSAAEPEVSSSPPFNPSSPIEEARDMIARWFEATAARAQRVATEVVGKLASFDQIFLQKQPRRIDPRRRLGVVADILRQEFAK